MSGIPWWSLIPLTTAGISLLTLPIALNTRRQQRRIAELDPILAARKRERERDKKNIRLGIQESLRTSRIRDSEDRKLIHKRHGISMARLFMLPALRIPIWLSFSLTLRSMSGLPIFLNAVPFDPSLQAEGIGWIPDLTQFDTLLILPMGFSIINLINIEINAREGRLGSFISNLLRIVSIGMIFVGSQMPASVCLYWTTSAGFAMIQNLCFKVLDAPPRDPT